MKSIIPLTEYAAYTDQTDEEALLEIARGGDRSPLYTLCEEDGAPLSARAAMHALENDDPVYVVIADD